MPGLLQSARNPLEDVMYELSGPRAGFWVSLIALDTNERMETQSKRRLSGRGNLYHPTAPAFYYLFTQRYTPSAVQMMDGIRERVGLVGEEMKKGLEDRSAERNRCFGAFVEIDPEGAVNLVREQLCEDDFLEFVEFYQMARDFAEEILPWLVIFEPFELPSYLARVRYADLIENKGDPYLVAPKPLSVSGEHAGIARKVRKGREEIYRIIVGMLRFRGMSWKDIELQIGRQLLGYDNDALVDGFIWVRAWASLCHPSSESILDPGVILRMALERSDGESLRWVMNPARENGDTAADWTHWLYSGLGRKRRRPSRKNKGS